MLDDTIPLIIGIAGGSGSGKTTIANNILARVGVENVAVLPHDAYYRDLSALTKPQRDLFNFDHPDALETELMIEHIAALKRGEAIELPQYDFSVHARRRETIRVLPQPVILVEGIMILYDAELRALLDIKVFIDTDADVRFIRRMQRDIAERGRTPESVIQQYLATVRPGYMAFVEPSKRYADIIVQEGGENHVAIDMLVARIGSLLPVRP